MDAGFWPHLAWAVIYWALWVGTRYDQKQRDDHLDAVLEAYATGDLDAEWEAESRKWGRA